MMENRGRLQTTDVEFLLTVRCLPGAFVKIQRCEMPGAWEPSVGRGELVPDPSSLSCVP